MGIFDKEGVKSNWEEVLENSEEELILENEESKENNEEELEENKNLEEKGEESEQNIEIINKKEEEPKQKAGTEKEKEEEEPKQKAGIEEEKEEEPKQKADIEEEKEEEPKQKADIEEEKEEEPKQKPAIEEEKEIEIPFLKLPNPTYGYKNDVSVFCFSQQGESHKQKDLPCQDRSAFQFIGKNVVIAAVADGVGSCALSDIGAEEAVNSSLEYLRTQLMPLAEKEEVLLDTAFMGKMLRETMNYAYNCVEKKAEELQQLLYTMQSTLTVAVYDGKTLFFAHAGDDGIVALNKSGKYALATSRHKGEEASSVYPLQSKTTWQYGKVDDATAFVMATDGVLDAFVRPESEGNRVYYPFMEPVLTAVQTNEEDAKKNCRDWYEYMASESYRERVTDDLSFIGIVNQREIEETLEPKFNLEKWNQESEEYEKKRMAALYPDRGTERKADAKKREHEHVKNNRKKGVFEWGNIAESGTSKIISVLEEGRSILEDQINQFSERFIFGRERKNQENEGDKRKKRDNNQD